MGKNTYEVNKELLNINPRYKMGFKLLSKEQLSNIFPTVDNLMAKFDVHREHITKYKKLVKNSNIQYNLMFDNIFSIFGKRGSGKTSVVFTISEILKNNMKHKEDIVLPVIIPEIIQDQTDIMGWILAILEEEVENIEDQLKRNKRDQQNSFFKDCHLEGNDKLREGLEEVKNSFFSSREDSFHSDSYVDSINRSKNKTRNGYQFSKNLSKFWDELCEAQKKIYECKEEPLIYIIFDDVDLTPHIVEELFSTIMKYLAYPNIIVILTADEQLLEQVINQKVEKEYYNESNCYNIFQIKTWDEADIPEYRYEKNTDAKLIQEMAEAYMNKVIPPSSRYYVLNFNNCTEKKKLIQKIENNHEINVEEFLSGKIKQYIKVVTKKSEREKIKDFFFNYEYLGKKYFIESYLTFFGMTCRQIGNECLIVEDFLSQLAKDYLQYKKKGNKEKYQNQMFLQIQIFVKNTLKNLNYDWDNDDFLRRSFYFEKENWRFFIDYDYIKFYCERKIRKNQSINEIADNVKKMIQIYHLYFFIENILIINSEYNDRKPRERVHGQRILVRTLDSIAPRDTSLIKLEEDDKRLKEFLYTYKDILEDPESLIKYDVNKYYCVRQYLNLYKNKIINKEDLRKNMEEWKLNHPKWFKSMVEAVVSAFSGIFCINEADFFVYERISEMDCFGVMLRDNMYKIQEGMQNAIKKRIGKEDKNIEEKIKRSTFEVKEEIEKVFEEIQEECRTIECYELSSEDSKKLFERIKNISKVGMRYEDLSSISRKINNEINIEEKTNGMEEINTGETSEEKKKEYYKIKSDILTEFREKIIKAYKVAGEKMMNYAGYFQETFEHDWVILSEILEALNGELDFKIASNKKEKIEVSVDKLVQLNEEYLMCKIKETKDNGYPESLNDLKKYPYIYEMYEEIGEIYTKHNKKNNFENYISNVVNAVLDSHINRLIDQKNREI